MDPEPESATGLESVLDQDQLPDDPALDQDDAEVDDIDAEEDDAPKVCRWDGCNTEYPSTNSLANHVNEDHIGKRKSKYTCEWEGCNRRGIASPNRHALITHTRKHTGEKPFGCPEPNCDKAYARQDALAKHVKAHAEEAIRLKEQEERKRKAEEAAALAAAKAAEARAAAEAEAAFRAQNKFEPKHYNAYKLMAAKVKYLQGEITAMKATKVKINAKIDKVRTENYQLLDALYPGVSDLISDKI
ncbi:hypothetical protein GQ42DRAFT_162787 [Ramicandelaber brevisporus]|nr:hypothetical protein GQ42DRAFT_162787 [Ramicandelaber brevisporus]